MKRDFTVLKNLGRLTLFAGPVIYFQQNWFSIERVSGVLNNSDTFLEDDSSWVVVDRLSLDLSPKGYFKEDVALIRGPRRNNTRIAVELKGTEGHRIPNPFLGIKCLEPIDRSAYTKQQDANEYGPRYVQNFVPSNFVLVNDLRNDLTSLEMTGLVPFAMLDGHIRFVLWPPSKFGFVDIPRRMKQPRAVKSKFNIFSFPDF